MASYMCNRFALGGNCESQFTKLLNTRPDAYLSQPPRKTSVASVASLQPAIGVRTIGRWVVIGRDTRSLIIQQHDHVSAENYTSR